ncbi:MAG: nucleoside triphosphate pyrophosphohydrolase [Deltaproteobacteria bacterium]|nr:nucleoside triphosphate pyrophosphohydrolase [Deltaproteobacteria bacterium]
MDRTKQKNKQVNIDALVKLIETLRSENGCPWDKKQTPKSMSVYLIEEMYELIEAIEVKEPSDVCEELGDVLFHIFFLADIFDEKGFFNIEDIFIKIVEKMVRRHPHVFGDGAIESADEVKEQWHKIKVKEAKNDQEASFLDSVPVTLPALMRAYRISERAATSGFDWEGVSGVMKKLDEELTELKAEIAEDKQDRIEMEYGDVLFTLVNIARFLKLHPETALKRAIRKFENRFKNMEKTVLKSGKTLESMSQDEMDLIWDMYKTKVG